jgi:hypothetical protein
MSYDLILILALALPVLIFVTLRVNAAMVFLSVCLGAILVEQVGTQAIEMTGLFTPKEYSASQTTINLVMLLAPAVLTTIVTAFSVHGRIKVALNLVPATAASMLAVLLAVPMLSRGLAFNLMSQQTWHILYNAEALVVGAGALVSLFFLWTQRRSFRKHDKRKH